MLNPCPTERGKANTADPDGPWTRLRALRGGGFPWGLSLVAVSKQASKSMVCLQLVLFKQWSSGDTA